MEIEQIANGINELYDNTNDSHKENIKTLIDNISNKNTSWLLEDIYILTNTQKMMINAHMECQYHLQQ